jgi:hypothetical protein
LKWARTGTVELELIGDKIAITFRSKIEFAATRHISLLDAVELSCLLLRSGNLKSTTNIATSGVALQVENSRTHRAWLTMSQDGEADRVACIEGSVVRDIGRRLHDHYLRAKAEISDPHDRSIYVRPVTYCYTDA